jgi:hypothetical protein
MVTCQRCAQQVDETTRSTCPNCFTPLPAPGLQPVAPLPVPGPSPQAYPGAPGSAQPPQQPYPPQPSRNPGTRVSLTGEVVEQNGPSAPPPSYVGGGAAGRPPAAMAPRSGGPASSRSAYASPRSEVPAKSGGAGKFVVTIACLLVLGGLGVGGWWFLRPHISPKTVVQQFDTAIATQDWKTVYMLVEMPADTKSKYPDANAFATDITDKLQQAKSNPMSAALVDSLIKAYQSAQVGEPTIDGDSAKVPVTMKISVAFLGKTTEQTSTQQVPLRKVNGAWKIDGLQGAITGAGKLGGM